VFDRAIAFFGRKEYDAAWRDVDRARELGYPVPERFRFVALIPDQELPTAKARAMGDSIVLSHRGGTGVTLYVQIHKEPVQHSVADAGAIDAEARQLELDIPTGQTSFAYSATLAEPIEVLDTFTWRGRTWSIQTLGAAYYGYVWRVTAIESKPLRQGP
jgi:hypothetical protein